MKKHFFLSVFLSAAVLSAACSEEPGVPVEYAKACSMENDKKNVEVTGFLDIKGGIFCSNTGGGPVRCGFKLKETAQAENGFSADIERGSGANTADQPESGFKREDIKVRDNAGAPVALGDKVKLTGKMNATPDGKVCYLTVSKIEKQ